MSDSKGLVKFEFEGAELRVQGSSEEPWFCAVDVCSALDIATEATRRLDEDEKGLRIVQTPGGEQNMVFINEAGLFSLVLSSRKPEAKRFKRWVTHEVLPAIRKTGQYETKARKQSSLLSTTRAQLSIIEAMAAAVAAVPGMQPDGVAVLKLNAIGSTFGVDPEPFRRALPSRPVKASLNATQVGALIEVSAREANRRLLTAGFLRKNEAGEWELTEKGATLGESFRFARNGHDGFEIRWRPEIADQIVDVVPAVEVLS